LFTVIPISVTIFLSVATILDRRPRLYFGNRKENLIGHFVDNGNFILTIMAVLFLLIQFFRLAELLKSLLYRK